MRYIILTILLLTFFCSAKSQDSISFKVIKIKSVKNFNVIYATRNDTTFKIVSKKVVSPNCSKIRIKGYYKFVLQEIVSMGGSEVDCFSLDAKTVICKEENCLGGLFLATNLKGLCLNRH